MTKQKPGSPAPGAEPIPVEKFRELILQDLKTARVLCHMVSKYQTVRDPIVAELTERVPMVSDQSIQTEAESAFQFLTYAIESQMLIDQVAEITQGLADNFKQKQDNARTMANSSDNAGR